MSSDISPSIQPRVGVELLQRRGRERLGRLHDGVAHQLLELSPAMPLVEAGVLGLEFALARGVAQDHADDTDDHLQRQRAAALLQHHLDRGGGGIDVLLRQLAVFIHLTLSQCYS
jgi:hypothetical protein